MWTKDSETLWGRLCDAFQGDGEISWSPCLAPGWWKTDIPAALMLVSSNDQWVLQNGVHGYPAENSECPILLGSRNISELFVKQRGNCVFVEGSEIWWIFRQRWWRCWRTVKTTCQTNLAESTRSKLNRLHKCRSWAGSTCSAGELNSKQMCVSEVSCTHGPRPLRPYVSYPRKIYSAEKVQ